MEERSVGSAIGRAQLCPAIAGPVDVAAALQSSLLPCCHILDCLPCPHPVAAGPWRPQFSGLTF
jgi:hypothetical protein